jgi:hypothetical protein
VLVRWKHPRAHDTVCVTKAFGGCTGGRTANIEKKIGLTGGHLFKGECLPPGGIAGSSCGPPMPGVFLCGACTHPGGGVIARVPTPRWRFSASLLRRPDSPNPAAILLIIPKPVFFRENGFLDGAFAHAQRPRLPHRNPFSRKKTGFKMVS